MSLPSVTVSCGITSKRRRNSLSDVKPEEKVFKQLQELKVATVNMGKWELSTEFTETFYEIVKNKVDKRRQRAIANNLLKLRKDKRFRKYNNADGVTRLALAFHAFNEYLKAYNLKKPENVNDCLLGTMYLDRVNPEVEKVE